MATNPAVVDSLHSNVPGSSQDAISNGGVSDVLKTGSRKRPYATSPHLEKLEQMLDVTGLIEQVERYIDQPIKIPTTLTVCSGQTRERQLPGKAKRDLLSVEDIWDNSVERRMELSTLYNTSSVGERKWLLDLLLEESDPDSGGDEEFTDDDIKAILKNHRDRREFQKEYHGDVMNSQYTYYGSGLISEQDRFSEHKSNVLKRGNFSQGK